MWYEEVPEKYEDLVETFSEFLSKIGNEEMTSRVGIVIDALNQMDESHHSHRLDWLPKQLPHNVFILISCLPGDCSTVLQSRDVPFIPVGPLDENDREEIGIHYIIDLYLFSFSINSHF